MNTKNYSTVREEAKAELVEEVTRAMRRSHERGTHRLCMHPNGVTEWFQAARPLPVILTVGTGTATCSCATCSDKQYKTRKSAVEAAVAAGDREAMEAALLSGFEKLPAVFFEDEEEE